MSALPRIETFVPPPVQAAPKAALPTHVGQGVTPLPLPLPVATAPNLWQRFWRGRGATALMGALSIASVLLFWQLATHYKLDAYIRFNNIPTPSQVLEKVIEVNASPKFVTNIGISVRRILLGFLVATLLGVGLGVVIGRYRLARALAMPALEVFRPIPAIAWVPMSIMLWPDNEVSIVFITFLGAFFPILLNTVHGVEAIDPVLLRAARTLGAGEASLLRHVVLPGALPHIFTGLAVGMGVAWVSLIAAEMISGQFGIGYFTWEAYSLISYAEIALGMITIGVLGLLCSGGIRLLAKLAMPWQTHSQGGR
ncbi:NitT/TauT family transport system permease protein [Pelomonas saccharophila]|uniref:NitT/TauT family transport system permease protein n=1 Tax=Roseateles saccharophilus TaxID=304 RepID=A0ABU1YHF5_ROSSA|nr:ABC transporter permease [Roseateles saccharophilus]MDR7268153.1 NitT/TauT family transport system permease protein [Roseateles saccharophilus]